MMKKTFLRLLPIFKSLSIFILMFLLIKYLSSISYFTNSIYPEFYNKFYPIYIQVFGWVPFSVGDIIYILVILYIIYNLYGLMKFLINNSHQKTINHLSNLINMVTIFVLIFHLFWGFNYQRINLIDSVSIQSYSEKELILISENLLRQCIEDRKLVNENDKGVFFYDKSLFNEQINNELNFKDKLPYHKLPNHTIKKFSFFSWFMRYFGVSGYYNPFTAEAQITSEIPNVSLPFTMAHEQAHQMGYAPEFEANFIGYITCIESQNPNLRYSANYKALKYILNALYNLNSNYVEQTLDRFSSGMKRDREDEREFYDKYRGEADQIFSKLNHIYLKSNQQQKGIDSYNQFVDLLVYYFKTNK